SKTFEYPFIPRSAGDFEIGPVEYSYYDINSGRYVTLKSEPLKLRVLRGEGGSAETETQILPSGVAKKGVKNLGGDIRYIATKAPSFKSGGSFFYGSAFFWSLFMLIVLGGAGFFVSMKYLANRRADVVGTKNRRATKMAQRRLKEAGGYLSQNLYSAFYEELHKALLGYVSDKLNMNAADLNKDNIAQGLSARGVSEDLVSEFVGLLDACEFARYSPDAGHDAMSAHYEAAVRNISSIDSSMKGRKTSSKAVTVIAALIAFSGVMNAAEVNYPDSLWTVGAEAYAKGDYVSAQKAWSSIADLGVQSADLFYNLGNASFKCGETGRSVLYYEKALKLNPSHSDAKFNLEFAQNQVQDKIDPVPEFILTTFARKICWLMSSDAWAVIFLILAAGFVVGTLIFLLSLSPVSRRVSFYSAIAALLLALCSLGFASWQKSEYQKADQAIVMLPVSSVKSSPSTEGSKDLFVLHEGTKVKVLDEVGEWANIEIADGRQGWIRTTDIDKI
nr:tetratricopeptide repeat protein [Bacteroidales bacterium]